MNTTYSKSEHKTWEILLSRRMQNINNEACEMYLEGFNNLKLPLTYIPGYEELNDSIRQYTDWQLVPTSELITSVEYFRMLANCQFPAITSIRSRKEIDFYTSPKPDVVHEYFGHGPYLTDKNFTRFMQKLAAMAADYSPRQQALLGRLFWYTIEFGLIQTAQGLRAYGAGILPSKTETYHALHNPEVERRPFNLLEVLRTTFSAVKKQRIYYIIPGFEVLYSVLDEDLSDALEQAEKMGSILQ